MKRGKALALALLLLFALHGALAAEPFPALNEDGFLEEGEFVSEDPEEGIWRYCSDTLWIEIHRVEQKKPARVWYEAEIRCAEAGDHPHVVANDPEKSLKGKREYPYKICRKTRTVLAVTGDFAHNRSGKQRGIVIRDGVVFGKQYPKKNTKGYFPNRDCLAIWPDGDMQVFYSDEKTPDDYLAEGVRDVMCFGPLLIRDGELNEAGIKLFGNSHAQRVAVGMVEKGHYWFMVLEGRLKRSSGDDVGFLGEKLLEKGCVLGFNLDGGVSAGMVFMGHQLNLVKEGKKHLSARASPDILGVGVSELVVNLGDPW